MQIYFTGAESATHLDTLRQCGVHRVGLSISNLARHTAHYDEWAASGRLNGLDWLVYADSTNIPVAPVLELLKGAPTEPEAVIGPVDWANTWLGESDILFLPLWDGRDPSELREYLELYDGTVLPDSAVDNVQTVRTAKASLGPMQVLGGLTGRSRGVERFDILVSSAWWAVPKHGETQVWSNNRLVRLSSEDKHEKRKRYADDIEALGCDVSAVLSDDAAETSKLAIVSWMALEHHLNRGRKLPAVADDLVTTDTPDQGGTAPVVVTSGAAQPRQFSGIGVTNVLPTMSTVSSWTQDEAGNQIEEHHLRSTSATLLQCNTCVLSSACPGYQAGSSCHYSIPVTIRTKEQRRSVLQTLTEIQTQRVLMGNFVEQINGERDDQVGKEMDRLFKMFESLKEIEETSSQTLSIHMKQTGETNSSGAISRLFGSEAGRNAQILDVPLSGEEMVEDLV